MVGIIIQARMGSHRLPGKILKDFDGKTLLGHIIYRLSYLQFPVKIVIATSNSKQDDPVEFFCRKEGILCFRGSEHNVLKRYYECAVAYGFQNIVRMTGDNPFCDVEELDKLIEYHLKMKNDFSENFSVLPIGVGMEIISLSALKKSLDCANMAKHFEHADEYILDHLNEFRHSTMTVEKEKKRPDVRLTVDTPEDYEKACFIIKNAGMKYITTKTAIDLEEKFKDI